MKCSLKLRGDRPAEARRNMELKVRGTGQPGTPYNEVKDQEMPNRNLFRNQQAPPK